MITHLKMNQILKNQLNQKRINYWNQKLEGIENPIRKLKI